MNRKLTYTVFVAMGVLLLSSFDTKSKSKVYERHMKSFNAELKLNSDYSYSLNKSGCTYHFKSKGIWKQIGDTIVLDHAKIKWSNQSSESQIELSRSSKLLNVHDDTLYFLYDLGNDPEPFQYIVLKKD